MSSTLGRIWFATQAAGVVAWWLLLLITPDVRPLFSIREAPSIALGAFAAGDLLLIALGSALVSLASDRRWATPLAWMVAGAVAYGAMYCLSIAVAGSAPTLGAALMVPAAALSIAAALAISRDRRVTLSGSAST